jgi:ABC-type amino acid transport substrate-binding protein
MVMTFENVTFAYLDEPPFCFLDPSGQPSGCDVELARTALSEIGVKKVEMVGVRPSGWTSIRLLF